MGARPAWFLRAGLIGAALFMIEGGWFTDLIGIGAAMGIYFIQKIFQPKPDATIPIRGAELTTRAGRRKKRPCPSSFPKYALRLGWPRNDRHGIRAGHENASPNPPPNPGSSRTPTRSTPARAPPARSSSGPTTTCPSPRPMRRSNTLLRDRRFGREPVTPREVPDHLAPFYAVEAHSMLELEPPRHTRLRPPLVLRAFTTRRIKGAGPRDRNAHPCADRRLPRGRFRPAGRLLPPDPRHRHRRGFWACPRRWPRTMLRWFETTRWS